MCEVIDVDPTTSTLTQKWIKAIVDSSAATTGSAFDFVSANDWYTREDTQIAP